MGYNAMYGLQYNDDMSMTEIKPKDPETINFLEVDPSGTLHVKREFAHCDVCGAKIEDTETAYVHFSYMYCEKCEKIHCMNARKEALRKKIANINKTKKKEKIICSHRQKHS